MGVVEGDIVTDKSWEIRVVAESWMREEKRRMEGKTTKRDS